jgi:uncharacterized protein (TIGR02594 family)
MKHVVEVALGEYGNKGLLGPKTSIHILKYFVLSGFPWVRDDETPWCAAFVHWCLRQAGTPVRGTLAARSFLTVGYHTTDPKLGDLVVLWRDSIQSANGHVGFFIRRTRDYVYILGGNQSNAVNILAFPVSRVLDYRTL